MFQSSLAFCHNSFLSFPGTTSESLFNFFDSAIGSFMFHFMIQSLGSFLLLFSNNSFPPISILGSKVGVDRTDSLGTATVVFCILSVKLCEYSSTITSRANKRRDRLCHWSKLCHTRSTPYYPKGVHHVCRSTYILRSMEIWSLWRIVRATWQKKLTHGEATSCCFWCGHRSQDYYSTYLYQ